MIILQSSWVADGRDRPPGARWIAATLGIAVLLTVVTINLCGFLPGKPGLPFGGISG